MFLCLDEFLRLFSLLQTFGRKKSTSSSGYFVSFLLKLSKKYLSESSEWRADHPLLHTNELNAVDSATTALAKSPFNYEHVSQATVLRTRPDGYMQIFLESNFLRAQPRAGPASTASHLPVRSAVASHRRNMSMMDALGRRGFFSLPVAFSRVASSTSPLSSDLSSSYLPSTAPSLATASFSSTFHLLAAQTSPSVSLLDLIGLGTKRKSPGRTRTIYGKPSEVCHVSTMPRVGSCYRRILTEACFFLPSGA